jgi:hypothetical protein
MTISLLGVERGRFCPGADVELVVDVFKVLADGAGADEQRLCDHGVRLTCRSPGQDDPFAWREAQQLDSGRRGGIYQCRVGPSRECVAP